MRIRFNQFLDCWQAMGRGHAQWYCISEAKANILYNEGATHVVH